MAESNSINAATTGVVGNTGTGFTGTPLTQYLVCCGGATSSTISQTASVGSVGQVLQSAGAGALPAMAYPLEYLISSQSASSSADIRFTDISNGTYNLVVSFMRPASISNLTIETSSNNGSTWATTGYLATEFYNNYNSATVNITNSTTNINLSTSQYATSGHSGFFNIWFSRATSGRSNFTCVSQYATGSATWNSGRTGAQLLTFNALRFICSTGNIATGTFALYRMPLS